MDKETKKVLSEGQILQLLVEGDGWGIVKQKLFNKVSGLDSISATIFDKKSDEEIAREMKARASAVMLVKEWIGEIEGLAAQHSAHMATLQDANSLTVKFADIPDNN